ncbi:hypothetical protein, partial [Enterobacter hormaechei]
PVQFQTKSAGMHPASWLRHPPGTPEPARNNRHKQVSLIIKSHQVSGRKTKHGLPPVNGNAEERFTG